MKPKLLFFVTEDAYFCSHRMALALAAKKEGYDVSVLTRVSNHGDIILNEGFNLIPLNIKRGSINPVQELITLISVCRIYCRLKPEIVHHVALKPILYGGIATLFNRKTKVVNLVAGLGTIFSSRKLKAKLLQPLLRFFLGLLFRRSCSRVIVQNSEDRRLLIDGLSIDSNSVVLIKGSGVDINKYAISSESIGIVSVALVSRMLWDKGVGEFVKAVTLLKQRGIEFRALLVGEPDIENMASVSQLQLDKWQSLGLLECTGFIEDVAGFWQQTHIAVLPSYREGLPKSLLEAAASGRPIVTTDTAGCNEVVKDGLNGFLVPIRDSILLADAIEKLILDSDLRKKMGIAGRKMIEQEFSDKQVIAETLNLYHLLLIR